MFNGNDPATCFDARVDRKCLSEVAYERHPSCPVSGVLPPARDPGEDHPGSPLGAFLRLCT